MIDIKEWTTERLILQETKEEDYEDLSQMLLDENVTMYLNEHLMKFPNIEIAKSFLRSIDSYYNLILTIRIKETNEIIGQTGYFGMLGKLTIFYWIGAKYQKKGYCSEAVVELSYHIFNKSKYDIFSIEFYSDNIGSRKIAYKIGEVMLTRNSKWNVIDKEDKITECEVFSVTDEYISIRMYTGDEKVHSYVAYKKNMIPDKYAQIGTKYTEKLRYFEISKNCVLIN